MNLRTLQLCCLALMYAISMGCGGDEPLDVATVVQQPVRLASDNLPNAIRLHERVISGGQPNGKPLFKNSKRLA